MGKEYTTKTQNLKLLKNNNVQRSACSINWIILALREGFFMTPVVLPAIWLMVLLAGLPQLCETVYTPSLPDIAHALLTSESMAEYTLTIYLFGFALGVLFWGKLSDNIGRKPCVLLGLGVFILGCVGCYVSSTIEMLMASRLIQAFGGSVGSVLGQTICRDAFHGHALGKAYASIGTALSLFPSLGPVVGGVIAGWFGWRGIFLFLILFTLGLMILTTLRLPETHHKDNRKSVSVLSIAWQLLCDKHVIGFGLIVAACNGIMFSYFAEGPFYLIQMLGLSPRQYGASFMMIGAAAMMGGMASKRLHRKFLSQQIMVMGIRIILMATTICSLMLLCHRFIFSLSHTVVIGITIMTQMTLSFGICMTTSNALAIALVKYKHCSGTASSLFGFFYYCFISFFTFIMGMLHDGTLLPMPLYFLFLSFFMAMVRRVMVGMVAQRCGQIK